MAILVFDGGSYGMRLRNPGKIRGVERLYGKGPAVDEDAGL
jgi:hypothetical protein